MIVTASVLPDVTVGMTDASATDHYSSSSAAPGAFDALLARQCGVRGTL
jgi:hypothetical protein